MSPRSPRRLRHLHTALTLFTLGTACSDPDDSHSPTSQPPIVAPPKPLVGPWYVSSYGGEHNSFELRIEGDQARIYSFGPVRVGHPGVLDAGDPFLKGIRLEGNVYRAQLARIQYGSSSDIKYAEDWPVAVTYEDVSLHWDADDESWKTGGEVGFRFRESIVPPEGDYDRTGACERSFINQQGARLYVCEYPYLSSRCETFEDHEKHFWPARSCAQLGYSFLDPLTAHWRHSEQSNVKPGAHGYWGDKSSGTPGGGGSGGSGGGMSGGSGQGNGGSSSGSGGAVGETTYDHTRVTFWHSDPMHPDHEVTVYVDGMSLGPFGGYHEDYKFSGFYCHSATEEESQVIYQTTFGQTYSVLAQFRAEAGKVYSYTATWDDGATSSGKFGPYVGGYCMAVELAWLYAKQP